MSDYISREAAIAFIREQSEEMQKVFENQGGESGFYADAYNDLAEDFHRIPAADVEPVRNGRWEECDWVDVDEHGFGTRRAFKAGLRCSQCACVFKKELLWKRNWCPSCGAKMDLEDEAAYLSAKGGAG